MEDGLFQVDLDFGDDIFTGQPLFLEVIVDRQALIPLQPIRPAPVALFALGGNEGPEGPEGASPFKLIGDTIEYIAEGQRIGFYPDGEGSSSFIAGHQNNQAAGFGATVAGGGLGHAPNLGTGNFSVIAGGYANTAGTSDMETTGSAIGGGGANIAYSSYSTISGGNSNIAVGPYSSIGGGDSNQASGMTSTIGGGSENSAASDQSTIGGGMENEAQANYSTIGGGLQNLTWGEQSTIGGGSQNQAYDQSTISGGIANIANTLGAIGGGASNYAEGQGASIGGGEENQAIGNYSVIGGGGGLGFGNIAYSIHGVISGGAVNTAGTEGTETIGSAIGGGRVNLASTSYATISGGLGNMAMDTYSTIGGGEVNLAEGMASTIAGGSENQVEGDHGTIGGGQMNWAYGMASTIGGGRLNSAEGDHSTISGGLQNMTWEEHSTIGGGAFNSAGGLYATISGGSNNWAMGTGSTVSGGTLNCAGGDTSWAGGHRAKIRPASDPGWGACGGLPSYPGDNGDNGDQGTFIWADSTDEDFISTGQNQFLVRASAGFGINTNTPKYNLHIRQTTNDDVSSGLMLEGESGSSAWSFFVKNSDDFGVQSNGSLIARIHGDTGDWEPLSDRRRKHSIQPINGVLEGVLQLSPSTFQFNGSNDSDARHLGYIAQDVARVFPDAVSQTDNDLMTIRPTALTALNTAALIEMNGRYEQRIGELEERLEKLEALLIEQAGASTATP